VNGSIPRERALALVLQEICPDWASRRIHESSPADRGMSEVLRTEASNYVASQYYDDKPLGSMVGRFRNENLEQQTFDNEAFDIVVSLDVMEHVYHPDRAFSEIHRTLVSNGVYICTFPVRKDVVKGHTRRFELLSDGSRKDFVEPEFHGNPVGDGRAIVTFDYGYDVHQSIGSWADFDVRFYRFNDRTHGILGEYTEVVVCRKR
jgi:SAM-dependent methyltransferase